VPVAEGSLADRSAWPLLPAERTWGRWRLAIALATAAAATWCYLIGEYVGYYLNFSQGAAALTAGCMIGMLLVFLAAGPICGRYGIDSVAATKPQFGSGGWVIPSLMQIVSIIGWNSLLLIFFAKSATQLLRVLGLLPAAVSGREIVPVATLLACSLIYFSLLWGAKGVATISKILVAHVLIGLWMLYLLVSHRWAELSAARPTLATPDRLWNYTTGVELGISSTLSWWPYVGAMIRMAPNARTAVLPVMLGMGAPVPLLSLIGLAGVLVLKTSDPAEWLRTVGGTAYAIVALLFVGAANFGTAITGIYSSAIGLRNFAALERTPWALLREVRHLPGVSRRWVCAALRNSDCRLLHMAPPPREPARHLRARPGRSVCLFPWFQPRRGHGARRRLRGVHGTAESADLRFSRALQAPDRIAARCAVRRSCLPRRIACRSARP